MTVSTLKNVLKVWNGESYDECYPKTTGDQVTLADGQDIQQHIDDLTAGLTTEGQARTAADAGLQGQLDGISSDLNAEAASRAQGDAGTLASAKAYADQQIGNIELPVHYRGMLALESGLPATSPNAGDYYQIDEMDVTAPGRQGSAIWGAASWDRIVDRHDAPDGETIVYDAAGATAVAPSIANHPARKDNPHAVTASQVGLGNVSNTSDANKPVSAAQQTALDGKLGKTENAATATKLAASKTIATNGDVTGTATAFDGSANISIPTTLASVTQTNTTSVASPAAGGTVTMIDAVTTDSKGRVTGANTKTITLPAAQTTITGNAATATKLAAAKTVQTNLASTTAASFDGTANITPGVSGTLPVANGGTGQTALASVMGVGSAAKLASAKTLKADTTATTNATFDGSGDATLGVYATLTDATAASALPATTASGVSGLLQTTRNCLKWLVSKMIPATQSAEGLMSAADKAKLDNAAVKLTGTQHTLAVASWALNTTLGRYEYTVAKNGVTADSIVFVSVVGDQIGKVPLDGGIPGTNQVTLIAISQPTVAYNVIMAV
jgi:hypothetical protein